jgi:hypothetical protein
LVKVVLLAVGGELVVGGCGVAVSLPQATALNKPVIIRKRYNERIYIEEVTDRN